MLHPLYFINKKLSDYQTIIDSLDPTATYYLIDSDTDGLTQMASILAGYSDLDAIHILSHGSVGLFSLGGGVYDQNNLAAYQIQLEEIGNALGATGDILLYGCNIGQGSEGQSFIDAIASYTGADVAASDDLTGSSVLGGDWELETIQGNVETITSSFNGYNDVLADNTAPTFTLRDGKVTTDLNGYDLTLQMNGKIVVAGITMNGSDDDFALVRYNADGTLDTSFGGDGKVTTDFERSSDSARSIIIQADGKIVVAGSFENGSDYDFALARYNADGTLDTSFGGDGKVTTDFGSMYDYCYSVTVQADSKIVVAGFFENGSDYDFALARYNADGTLDTSFGGDGKVTTDFGSMYDDLAFSITVQADGKILVAGGTAENYAFALTRYNTDGSLDTTFSGDGKVTTNFGAFGWCNDVALQIDGKIVVAGITMNGSDYDFALVRYNADGTLDTSFGGDGKVTTDFERSSDSARSIIIQADGKIVVAGSFENGSDYDFALARYNADGTLDTSFGGDGKVTTDFGTSSDSAQSIIIQADGKIVVVGGHILASYNADGMLDNTFSALENTLGGTVAYRENDSPVVLDTDVQIFDYELSSLDNYNGAIVTLFRHGGANSDDLFSFKSDGTFTALTQGSYFWVDNVAVGRVTTNSEGLLKLTFNSNATEAIVNKTLRQIAYANSSPAPDASVKIDWMFTDGNTGAQGTGGALSVTESTTINITSINEAPILQNTIPDLIIETNQAFTYIIPENTFIDRDGESLTYSVTMSDGKGLVPWLSFDSDTKTLSGIAEVYDSGVLNIVVKAIDGFDKYASDSVTLVVDSRPMITSSSTGVVAENAAISTVIYTATATDVDAGTTLTYSLSGSDVSLLNINSTTGAVTLKTSANYEAKSSYSFNVVASDGTLSDTKAVTVSVSNVNETPSITSASTGAVAENAATNTVIYTATATDVDAGTTLTYSLSGSDASLLNINSTTGAVTLKTSANYEAKSSYSFNVIASDGSLNDAKAVIVSVTNVNEAVFVSNTFTTINEDTPLTATLPIGFDADGDSLSYSVINAPVHGSFSLNSNGSYSYIPSLNFYGTDSFGYKVSDGYGGFDIGKAFINILPVQDPITNFSTNITSLELIYDRIQEGMNNFIDGSENGSLLYDEMYEYLLYEYPSSQNVTNTKMTLNYYDGSSVVANGSGFTSGTNFTMTYMKYTDSSGDFVEVGGSAQFDQYLGISGALTKLRYNDGSDDLTMVGSFGFSGENARFTQINLTTQDYSWVMNGNIILAGDNHSGTVTSVNYHNNDGKYFTINKANIDASIFDTADPVYLLLSQVNMTLEQSGVLDDHFIFGTDGNDVLNGTNSDDILYAGKGNDAIDGGTGTDKCYFDGLRDSYSLSKNGNIVTIASSNGTVTLSNVERVIFSDTEIAFDTADIAGQAYRIYQAAFDRIPDKEGLGYWIDSMDKGFLLQDVANSFLHSNEFQSMYGTNPTDEAFVTLLYNNILNRDPDQSGMDYWLDELSHYDITHRSGVLASFSESDENQSNVANLIGNGIEYIPWM